MKVFINAGHGGTDVGAVSRNKIKEADITKKVAEILCKKLEENSIKYEFYQQIKHYFEISQKENKSNADLFISIHCNSAVNPNANGIETLYCLNSLKGKKFAEITQAKLIAKTGLLNRGIKPRNDIHVLNRTKSPAILVELAFLSNYKEEKMLINKPEIFANAILDAIKEWFK